MNIEADLPGVGKKLWSERPDVRSDVERIDQMWSEQLAASGGPMLFGAFSAVDAFYAPVCARARTYGLPLSAAAEAYVKRVADLASVQAWNSAALTEHDFVAADEPYRQPADTLPEPPSK